MKILGKLAAAGLALALSASAQAAIMTYEYTAIVNRVTEYDRETDTFTNPDDSNFVGTRVGLGDVIHGTLRYDTSAPESDYKPEDRGDTKSAMYKSTPEELLSYRFSSTGLSFHSEYNMFGYGYVANSPAVSSGYSSDYFSKDFSIFDDVYLRGAGLFFWNANGTAFDGTGLPQQLDAALFQSISLSGTFMNLSSENMMFFHAEVTSFRLAAEVPEPGALLLLGVGAAGLLVSRCRTRPRAC